MISLLNKTASDSRLPLYQQLRDLFTQKIQDGQWSDSHAIPSELELAQEYEVSPGTARKAIESLVADGFLTRKQGSGTFVRRAHFGNALFRFFRHTDESGNVLEPRSRILSITCARACETEAEKLELGDPSRGFGLGLGQGQEEQVIRIQRIRQVSAEPLVYEKISLSAPRFQPLLTTEPTTFGDLLYPLYDSLCQIRVQSATETVSFGLADRDVAKHLCIPIDSPVAVIERLAFDIQGDPVEWRISYGLASKFNYSVELK